MKCLEKNARNIRSSQTSSCANCLGLGHWFRIERTRGVRKEEVKVNCVACGGTGRPK